MIFIYLIISIVLFSCNSTVEVENFDFCSEEGNQQYSECRDNSSVSGSGLEYEFVDIIYTTTFNSKALSYFDYCGIYFSSSNTPPVQSWNSEDRYTEFDCADVAYGDTLMWPVHQYTNQKDYYTFIKVKKGYFVGIQRVYTKADGVDQSIDVTLTEQVNLCPDESLTGCALDVVPVNVLGTPIDSITIAPLVGAYELRSEDEEVLRTLRIQNDGTYVLELGKLDNKGLRYPFSTDGLQRSTGIVEISASRAILWPVLCANTSSSFIPLDVVSGEKCFAPTIPLLSDSLGYTLGAWGRPEE